MIQATDIKTFASDIQDTSAMIMDAMDDDYENEAMEKELDDIANRLWKIKTQLRGGE